MYEPQSLARKERLSTARRIRRKHRRSCSNRATVYLSYPRVFGLLTTDRLRSWVTCFKDLSTISNTTDRLNDLTQQQAKEKQQELREAEANNEVKDEEKHADVRIAEDIQNMQKTKAQDQAQAIGNPNLLEDEAEGEFRMEVEQE